MTTGQLEPALKNWMVQQRRLAQSLLDHQRDLIDSIRAGDADRIEPLSIAQGEYVTALESGRRELSALLVQSGFSDDTDGIEAAIREATRHARTADQERQLHREWQALREALVEIRDNNRHNGLLAEHQHRAIRQTLLQLRGHSAPQTTGYGPRGERMTSARSRVIALA